MSKNTTSKNWTSNAINFSKNVSIPITNQVDDLFRNYLKDFIIISGVFTTIIGTFLIRQEFNDYPFLSKLGFLLSMVGFLTIIITAIFYLGKSVKELIPGAIYANKVSAVFGELSYFDALLARGEITDDDFTKRKNKSFEILQEIKKIDRSAMEKINMADKTEKKLRWIIGFIQVVFIIGICLFTLSLALVFLLPQLQWLKWWIVEMSRSDF